MVIFNDIDFSDNDTEINSLCNEYYYQTTLKTKGVHTSKNRKFSSLKEKKPLEWLNLEKLYKLCLDNNISYKEYIPYALGEIYQIHKFVHPKYFLNPIYVAKFKDFKEIEKQYKNINHLIITSFKKIIILCKDKQITTFTDFIKNIIREKKLGHYMKCGIISRYILALIPNIKTLRPYFDDESIAELDIYVLNKIDKLNDDAKTSLMKFDNIEYINIIDKINRTLK